MPCMCICICICICIGIGIGIFLFIPKTEEEYWYKWCMNMDFIISFGILLRVPGYLRMLWPAVMCGVVLNYS